MNHFVSKFAQRMGKDIRFISRDAMAALTNAPWKGNVREVGNFIERCVILTQGNKLNVPHLEAKDSAGRQVVPVALSFWEAERRVIIDALNDASGRISGKGGAAERLGLKRTTLQNKMRRLSISRSDYSADQYTNRIVGPQATSRRVSGLQPMELDFGLKMLSVFALNLRSEIIHSQNASEGKLC